MSDYIVRAISTDGLVQAAAICSRGITERARQIHHTSPVATAALGRALAGASMMGNALKGQGASLTLQIKGGGPLGTVLAVSDAQATSGAMWQILRRICPCGTTASWMWAVLWAPRAPSPSSRICT